MKVDMKIKVPDGYELTGEYRHVNTGEYYLYVNSFGLTSAKLYNIPKSCMVTPHLILRKIEVWRSPTIDDLKRFENGGIPARVGSMDCFIVGWEAGAWIVIGPFNKKFYSTCVKIKD